MSQLACSAVIAAFLVAVAPASAAPEWRPHETIAPTPGITYPQAGIDALGFSTVVWSGAGQWVSVRPPGERFGAPQSLAPWGAEPKIAVAPQGGAVVVFSADRGYYAVRPAGARLFEAVRPLPTPTAERVRVATDAQGNAIITWVAPVGGSNRLHIATRTASGILGPTQVMDSDAGGGETPVVNERGDAVIGTALFRRAGELFTKMALPQGSWQQATIDGVGNVYLFGTDPAGAFQVRTRWVVRAPDGQFGPRRSLDRGYYFMTVAMDEAGRAVMTWREPIRDENGDWQGASVSYSVKEPGGDFGPVQSLGGRYAFEPRLAVNPRGAAAIVWSEGESAPSGAPVKSTLMGSVSAPGGGFTDPAPINLLGTHDDPALAIDRSGRAVVAWEGSCFPESDSIAVNAATFEEPEPNGWRPPCNDRTAPVLAVATRSTRMAKSGRLGVKLSCSESCTISAAGKVMVRERRARPLPAKGLQITLPAAPQRQVTVALRLSRARTSRVRRALRRRRKVALALDVRARDRFGNLRSARRRIRVKR